MRIHICKIQQALVFVFVLVSSVVSANPVLNNVASGNVLVTQSTGLTQVQQTSEDAIINWKSFNIGSNEKTEFNQPNTNAITLNRISSDEGASLILGSLSANGTLILVNQAGIFFGSGANVNVGSLIASTSDISDANFTAGHYIFSVPSSSAGSIMNKGNINAANYGLVALLGTAVINSGVIQASLGNIVLASGSKFTIGLTGDQLINFTVDAAALSAGVNARNKALKNAISNTGSLIANDGNIYITANVAENLLDNAINMKGLAQAASVSGAGGNIILSSLGAGKVKVSGKLIANGTQGGNIQIQGSDVQLGAKADVEANGSLGGGNIVIGSRNNTLTTTIDHGALIQANALVSGNGGSVSVLSQNDTDFNGAISAMGGAVSGNGGSVETSGYLLNIDNSRVNLTAANGKTGTWLLDPGTLDVITGGSGSVSNGQNDSVSTTIDPNTVDAALNLADLILNADTNITITNGIAWTSSNTLTLSTNSSGSSININSSITGSSGGLIINTAGSSDVVTTSNAGSIAVNTFVLQSGAWTQVVGQNGLTALPSFSSPENFAIQGGTFLRAAGGDGSSPSTSYLITDVYGLQGVEGFLSSDFTLNNNIDASMTATWNSGSGFHPIASSINVYSSGQGYSKTFNGAGFAINQLTSTSNGLFGQIASTGIVENLGLTNADIRLTNTGNSDFGILAGANLGHIINSYTTGSISNTGTGNVFAGFVGINMNSITTSYSAASVSNSDSNGSEYFGGLVGQNGSFTAASITDSYATGKISNVDSGNGQEAFGGLIGIDEAFGGSVSSVYATGNVSSVGNSQGGGSSDRFGGLVGWMYSGTIQNAYSTGNVSNVDVSGQAILGGFAGDAAHGTINNSYSTGIVTNTDTGTANEKVGGFAGTAGNFTADFFDTGTSGMNSTAACGNSPSCSGVTGSTYAASLSALSTFMNAAWNISAAPGSSTTWAIIDGVSYPYLTAFYPTTPRVIRGVASTDSTGLTGVANIEVGLTVNGSSLATSNNANGGLISMGNTYTAADGSFYFLEGQGAIPDTSNGSPSTLLISLLTGPTGENVATLPAIANASLTNLTVYQGQNPYPNNNTSPPSPPPTTTPSTQDIITATAASSSQNNSQVSSNPSPSVIATRFVTVSTIVSDNITVVENSQQVLDQNDANSVQAYTCGE